MASISPLAPLPPLTKPPSPAGGEGPVHLGLTSGFLKGLKAGDTLEVFTNKYVLRNGKVLRERGIVLTEYEMTESGKILTENEMLTESGKILTGNEMTENGKRMTKGEGV